MDTIDELLTRGVDTIYPSKDELEKVLRSGKKLRIYQGFDPTSSQLHIGHMVGLRKLRGWQDMGHHVIFLIGDFTGMVGDPTGKDKTRIPLTKEQVIENAKTYKQQAGKILKFDGKNPVEIKYNSDWLAKLSALEFARLASHLSVQQVVERDMFQKRIKNKMDISLSEFFYPLMQAYDSIAMDIDVEIGGTDQMFNMMMGRDLMHKIKQKNKFVMTTPLLVDSEGKKIGKTEGNAIGLTDKPEDLYGKIMGIADDAVGKCFEYLTDISSKDLQNIYTHMKYSENPLQYKKQLAYEIVKQLNSAKDAEAAQEHFEKTVQKKEMPEAIDEIVLSEDLQAGKTIAEVIAGLDLATSKSEAKRLIEQGGVTIDNEVVIDPNAAFEPKEDTIIKVGKRKFVKIKI